MTVIGADENLRSVQLAFLRQAAVEIGKGKIPYPLRLARTRERHVLLYGSHTRTFCGLELKKTAPKYEPYNDETLARGCAECREAVARLAKEAIASGTSQEKPGNS
jgi:hypothetical protein